LTQCEIAKKSPFSDALDLADDYVISYTAIKNSQMRTAYKKEWEIETRESCGSSQCNEGVIYSDVDGTQVACGRCAELKLGENALRLYTNPVGENSSDVPLLDYQIRTLTELELKIKNSCLGQGFSQDNPNVSKNQMQVMSNYDSIESVLNFWSADISSVWKFQNDSIAKLSFGNEFEYSSFSLGNKYFFKTEEQIEITEKIARENGAPNYILEDLRIEKINTKYKNNPDALLRQMILDQIEPLKEYNTADIQTFFSSGVIPKEQLILKINFVDFVNRYERENGIIRVVGNDFEKSVNIVKEVIYSYISINENEEEVY
jgi:hypothetical protein